MSLARSREALRKADTRHKIELGGLVIKAGLGDEDKAVILGALMEAARSLQNDHSGTARKRLKRAGKGSFTTGDDLI